MRRIIVISLLMLFALPLSAQQRGRSRSASAPVAVSPVKQPIQSPRYTGGIKGRVVDAAEKTAMPGAVVRISAGGDSLFRVTDDKGYFSVERLIPGQANIRVTHLGYTPATKIVQVGDETLDIGTVALTEGFTELQTVVIRQQVPLMRRDGDTIKYSPLAVPGTPYDFAVDLVEKLPGIELDEDRLTALGKPVQWVLVDGKLLFGRDAMNALENVKVSDIRSVNVYDIRDPERPFDPNDDDLANRQRVIDIKTWNGILRASNMEAFGGWGMDLNHSGADTPVNRYLAGGNAKWFSEKTTVKVDAQGNNIGRQFHGTRNLLSGGGMVNGYVRHNRADVQLDRNNPFIERKGPGFMIGYSFANDHNSRDTRSERVYFAPDTRHRWDSTFSRTDSYIHTVKMDVTQRFRKRDIILSLTPVFRFTDDRSHNARISRVEQDGELLTRTGSSSDSRQTGFATSGSLRVMVPLRKSSPTDAQPPVRDSLSGGTESSRPDARRNVPPGQRRTGGRRAERTRPQIPIVWAGGSWDYNRTKGNGWQIDTVSTAAEPSILSIRSNDHKKQAAANASLSNLTLSPALTFNAAYRLEYDHSLSLRTAIDTLTGVVDLSRTYNYTRNYLTQEVHSFVAWHRKEKPFEIRLGAAFRASRSDRDERAPREVHDRRTFLSVLPSLSIASRHGESFTERPSWSVGYSTYSTEPSIESLRGWLDSYNILSLRLGNPRLKQSYIHSLQASYSVNRAEKGTSTHLQLAANYTQNAQATRSIFFAESTWLAEHQIWAVPGATLITYENVDGAFHIHLSGNTSRPVARQKLILRFGAGFSLVRRPAYIQDVRNFTLSSTPQANLSLQSNHSKTLDYRVMATSSYTYANNTAGGDNRTFSQRITANVRLRFLRNFTAASQYQYHFYHSSGADDITNHQLNAALGYRFLKGNGEVRFSVYDILNRTQDFSSSVLADHIVHTWRQVMSRYFTFTLSYRFNKTTGK